MKRYFNVHYHHGGSVYCAHIAHAESMEAVYNRYSALFNQVVVSDDCTTWSVADAKRRGKPIVEID